ncbi:MAG: hypothetical protein HYY01_08870 [Chloroflexi bacterium]|nr:hypothetical protein [Chloroflexota bacterium]
MRTHLVLSEELVREIDALVGKRQRSRFVEEAARDKLKRERLLKALRETAGILSAEDHPEWATREDVYAWVRKLREQERDPWRDTS